MNARITLVFPVSGRDWNRYIQAMTIDDASLPAPRLMAATDRFFPADGSPPVEWLVLEGLTSYGAALEAMETRAAAIADGRAPEAVMLVEHPPLYTAGTGADEADLLDRRFPVFSAGRGGQYTYHGPGQRIAYVMLDVGKRGRDVRRFVQDLERWIITALDRFNVTGEIRPGRVGVWVARPDKPLAPDGTVQEDKIAALGIRLHKWVSFHGLSINVEPDLSHFDGIVPCGIRDRGVTSLVDLGLPVTMADLDVALRQTFGSIFSDTPDTAGPAQADAVP